jgi:hypothetical protein
MKKCVGMFVTGLLTLASVGVACAASGPGTKAVTAIIRGTGAVASSGDIDVTTGACNVTAWVDTCPSGNCTCVTLSSPVVVGNRKLTVSNVFFTIDNGVNPATEPAQAGGPDPRCNLALGTMDLAATNGSSSETLNIIGTTCKHVIGISTKNPTGTHDQDLLSGGWGISADPAPSPAASGWGTMTGTDVTKTSLVTLKFSGWVSQ